LNDTFKFLSREIDIKLCQNYTKTDSQAPVGYNRFQIGCALIEYYLYNTTTFIQNLAYARFGLILTQFYVNFSR